jgi:hypothetical protein
MSEELSAKLTVGRVLGNISILCELISRLAGEFG